MFIRTGFLQKAGSHTVGKHSLSENNRLAKVLSHEKNVAFENGVVHIIKQLKNKRFWVMINAIWGNMDASMENTIEKVRFSINGFFRNEF